MRAALYVRVSTKDKEKDGQAKPRQHTANQIDQLRAFCQSQDWEIVAEYEDHESGSRADRAQFQVLMREASQRRFDVVVFWALDRFTREGALQTLQIPESAIELWRGLSILHRALSRLLRPVQRRRHCNSRDHR